MTISSELERDTMKLFLDLIHEDPLVPVMKRPQLEYYTQTVCLILNLLLRRVQPLQLGPEEQKQVDHLSQFYSDFRSLDASELPEGVATGATFTTVSVQFQLLNYKPQHSLRSASMFRDTYHTS